MKRNSQFWHLKFADDYDKSKETFREYRCDHELYYDHDKKMWVHRAEYTGSWYPATFPSGAGGVNEVQYAALLMMIARYTGYKPGVFTHFVANEQIYDRHINQAKEMLKRVENLKNSDTQSKPMLKLNPEKTNFYDMTIEDFSMENYDPIVPQLKLELGI